MKYAMLIYPKPGSHEGLAEEDARALTAEYIALRADPGCIGGGHLQPGEMATTVRHGGATNLITDGPFADAKEVLAGYYVLEASDFDGALEFAQRIPAVRLGGAVEPAGRHADGDGALIEQVFQREWGRVLASLVGFLGDIGLAEDAAQEAFEIAAERWPREGPPERPVAWLVATGRNRAIDRIRRERTLRDKTRLLEADRLTATMDELDLDDSTIPDERLELIFTCCRPALAVDAQVALTLRALGGLTTDEIARAFLVPEETMKRRLTRAKAKIKATAIPFAVPADHRLPDRLAAVLAVVYLIFNQGYPARDDLAAEAIRLGRVLADLMADEPEVHGLLALMLLHDSRRQARVVNGQLVPLAEQDRARHDHAQAEQGRMALERALALRPAAGPYVLQAAIASLQAEPEIDWQEVVLLYEGLEAVTSSRISSRLKPAR